MFIGILFSILSSAFAQQVIPTFICDGVQNNTYVRNVSDCSGFIRCGGPDGPIGGFCPTPYYFNSTRQVCTVDSVQCFNCSSTGLINIPVENSCSRFIRCLNGIPSEGICPDELQFNPITTQCDLETSVGCKTVESSLCPPNLPTDQVFAYNDARNCSM